MDEDEGFVVTEEWLKANPDLDARKNNGVGYYPRQIVPGNTNDSEATYDK
jgi:hypothetical protein